jgi:hypothetical protein
MALTGMDADNAISATRFIVLDITVDPVDMTVSYPTISAVASATAEECSFDNDGQQTGLRVILGKVVVADGSGTTEQGWWFPMRITHRLLNGAMVRVAEAAFVIPPDP